MRMSPCWVVSTSVRASAGSSGGISCAAHLLQLSWQLPSMNPAFLETQVPPE
jgi:hypothetical protein